jgi:hypothetical protein
MSQQILTPSELINQLNLGPVDFAQVIACIDHHYEFTAVAFKNGDVDNEAGTNLGSCKILAFAKLHQLSESSTLNAFGAFYTEDVLRHPDATDHQNIRNFMRTGWQGVIFAGDALKAK